MENFFESYNRITYVGARDLQANSFECGYCGNTIAPHLGYQIINSSYQDNVIAYVYMCPHCKNPILYFVDSETTLPGSMYGRRIKNLPEKIEALYSECRTCYANHCYTSSQMIARTILMHIAVE